MVGIKKQSSEVKSHHVLRSWERYHSFLCRVYNKIRSDAITSSPDELHLQAVKTVNSTAAPLGLVPTMLVFRLIPRILVCPKDLPPQTERIKAMQSTRDEHQQIICKQRLKNAFRHNVPAGADPQLVVIEEVQTYSEKPIGKWVRPCRVAEVDSKQITMDTEEE